MYNYLFSMGKPLLNEFHCLTGHFLFDRVQIREGVASMEADSASCFQPGSEKNNHSVPLNASKVGCCLCVSNTCKYPWVLIHNSLQSGHTNLMFCFTSTPTQYFANLIHKCKLVGVA